MCGINDQQTQKKLLAEKPLSFDRAIEIALAVKPATKAARDITSRMYDNAPLHVVSDKTPPVANNVDVITPTLDSFYLDTIHDTEDSTFWMIDVKVNNIFVTFKVGMRRCRGNSSLRKYPTDFGSAGGQHARQETVWTKWCFARLEGKAHSNFISEVAQMLPGYICELSRASSHQRLALIISSLQYRVLPYYCYQTRVSKFIYRAGNTSR